MIVTERLSLPHCIYWLQKVLVLETFLYQILYVSFSQYQIIAAI